MPIYFNETLLLKLLEEFLYFYEMTISKTEKKVLVYVAIFIAISVNMTKLLSFFTKENNVIGLPWNFNLPEIIFQTVYFGLFTYFLGYFLLKTTYKHLKFNNSIPWAKLILFGFSFTFLVLVIGVVSQKYIFQNVTNDRLFVAGYIVRFFMGIGLISILIKILLMYKQQQIKDVETEKLKTAYSDAKLNNLRDQINPHFLFNSFTNLSTLIRESPIKAQNYVAHLSKVFRSSLANNNNQIVALHTEIQLLYSYVELYKLRLEDALDVQIELTVVSADKKILHMSLQPLLENAIKHNLVNLEHPLRIDVVEKKGVLIFMNTIKAPLFNEPSNGIGLLNLNERYKMLVGKDIEIQKTENHFIVKLPLI